MGYGSLYWQYLFLFSPWAHAWPEAEALTLLKVAHFPFYISPIGLAWYLWRNSPARLVAVLLMLASGAWFTWFGKLISPEPMVISLMVVLLGLGLAEEGSPRKRLFFFVGLLTGIKLYGMVLAAWLAWRFWSQARWNIRLWIPPALSGVLGFVSCNTFMLAHPWLWAKTMAYFSRPVRPQAPGFSWMDHLDRIVSPRFLTGNEPLTWDGVCNEGLFSYHFHILVWGLALWALYRVKRPAFWLAGALLAGWWLLFSRSVNYFPWYWLPYSLWLIFILGKEMKPAYQAI